MNIDEIIKIFINQISIIIELNVTKTTVLLNKQYKKKSSLILFGCFPEVK